MSDAPKHDLKPGDWGDVSGKLPEYLTLPDHIRNQINLNAELRRENAELRAKFEQEHDIRVDLSYMVTKIAQNLCVQQEPHQTFDERLIETLASIVRDANETRDLRAQLSATESKLKESEAALALYTGRIQELTTALTNMLVIQDKYSGGSPSAYPLLQKKLESCRAVAGKTFPLSSTAKHDAEILKAAKGDPLAYIYYFDAGYGGVRADHRSLSPDEWNGQKPYKAVPVYAQPEAIRAKEEAKT